LDASTLLWLILPGLATGLGGLVLLTTERPSDRALDTMLGFTAGVMLAASVFSLLVPALDHGGLAAVIGGFLAGSAFIALLDREVPHAHARFREHGRRAAEERQAFERARLLLAALTIHNVPEGLAVGLAFAAGGTEMGVPLALAISIQNVPEGFAAAAPLLGAGVSRRSAALVAAGTGLVEPPAALAAFAAFELADSLLAGGLAFAAGAMLYVVVDELIPEGLGRGNELQASLGLLAGFLLMLVLDSGWPGSS
jgi:ZIP family zinc transporter